MDVGGKESRKDITAYDGNFKLLAESTRKFIETIPNSLQHARNGKNGPTLKEFLEEAAKSFDTGNGGDAWVCLMAAELIVKGEGQLRHIGLRLRQLRRGRASAPMLVSTKTLKGFRLTSIYHDVKMVTKFYRCIAPCEAGNHFGVRVPEDLLNQVKNCPFCGGLAERHNITISELINNNGVR